MEAVLEEQERSSFKANSSCPKVKDTVLEELEEQDELSFAGSESLSLVSSLVAAL
jgi:hypothetical protein